MVNQTTRIMPKYEITSPDGKKFEVTAPDGATQDQVLSYAQQQFGQPQASPQPEASPADMVSGSRLGRLAAGVASPLLGAAQLGAHGIDAVAGTQAGPWMDKQLQDYEAAKQRGMKAAGNEGYDFMGLLGSLIPGGAIAKGVSGVLPQAASLPTKMLSGAAAGGATAAAQPVTSPDFASGKAEQIAGGAAIGGAIPLAAQGVMAGKALFEPFYQKGQEAIIGRALNTAAGQESPQIAQALQQVRQIVPGSQPTVGQASQNAGLASLERSAGAILPEGTNNFAKRAIEQNAARGTALGTVAKDENAMAAAIQARKAATAGLLNRVEESEAIVDPSRTVELIDSLIKRSPGRTKLTSTLEKVKKSLFEEMPVEGVDLPDGTPLLDIAKAAVKPDYQLRSNVSQLYQGARKNLTDLLHEKAGDGSKLNEAISRELTVVMKSLDHQINKAEPAYGQFMQKYAEASKPINQMQIGQEIQKKATNAVGQVQLNPLAAALSDKTAQRATGFKRATLEGTMTPEQMNTLNSVKEDLIRQVQANNMAGTAGSDTVKKLAYSNLIDRAGVPTFLREFAPTQTTGNLLARGADSIYGKANRDLQQKLADTLLDPQEAGRMMRQVGPSRFSHLIDALVQQAIAGGGTIAGRGVNQ
jgi:hypothetical protein